MNKESPLPLEIQFSRELIYQQLQRIFSNLLFQNSDILRRFLSFIVDETLLGQAHTLKEYTIGVQVLNKPVSFKPQENGIVRIHAGRLRRALNHYYAGAGALDPICISVPLGSYVPVFSKNDDKMKELVLKGDENIPVDENDKVKTDESVVVAVIPFLHLQNDQLENSLADGLGMQLSAGLMQFEKFSVVAYYTVRNLYEKITDIGTIAAAVAAQYIVTGNIQLQNGHFRIHIQMIHIETSRQVWGHMYVGKFTAQNIFLLQDKIEKCFITDLNKLHELITKKVKIDKKLQRTSVMAVA
jgi:TolB-like protein